MKRTHVGTLTGSAQVALTAVATDRIHTGLHVTLTSQQNDSVGVQVLLKRGADQYRLHRVEELGAKDSVSFPLAHVRLRRSGQKAQFPLVRDRDGIGDDSQAFSHDPGCAERHRDDDGQWGKSRQS